MQRLAITDTIKLVVAHFKGEIAHFDHPENRVINDNDSLVLRVKPKGNHLNLVEGPAKSLINLPRSTIFQNRCH